MPSWNIHIEHTEHLLADETPEELGVRDVNAFLFGNVVPDIYVGYVVSPITHKIEYAETHDADPLHIPMPNASRFYRRFVQGGEGGSLELGAWTHLICDHYYNLRTTEYIASIGVEQSRETRIRKQADFDLFGRTFAISSVPVDTAELIEDCAHFAQYPIEEPDVHATIAAARGIVERNRRERVHGIPAYDLLPKEFFSATFAEVDTLLREALHLHAAGGDPTHIGRP